MRNGAAAAALVLLIVVVVALSVGSVRLDSATADEPAHIVNGVIKLDERWLNFFREQPPLMNSLSALPVVLAGYRVLPGWKGGNHWVVGRRFLYRSGYDAYRILFLGRLPTIALFAALCVVVYWFVKWRTGSAWWGLAAAALTGFCPNLMAHGRLATVDLALTFFAFAASALLLRLIERPSIPIGIVLGLATIAAVMSKISGVILAPYFVIVIVAALAMRRIAEPKRFFAALAIGALAALAFFEAFTLAEASGEYIRETYPSLSGPIARLAVPFAEYVNNVRTIQHWYGQGHSLPQFFLGRFSYGSWPAYYPMAFLLKTTIPAILLIVFAVLTAFRKPQASGLGTQFTLFALFGFVVLFFAFAAVGHLALGIRYVLPIYPFLYAATAIALSLRPEARGPRARRWIAAVALLIAWHIGENVANYPGYLSYFNELIGSRRNADELLVDSNLDWGQDLRRLNLWCRDNHVPEITVHYFGGGDVPYEMRASRTRILYAPLAPRLPPGWFALSRHFYRLSFFPPVFGIDYDTYLEASHARYVTTIGGSIDVYRVEP